MRFARTLVVGWLVGLALAAAGCFAVLDFSGYTTGDAPGSFPGGDGSANDAFQIALDRTELTLSRGDTVDITLSTTRSKGFAGALALSLTGAEGQVTGVFDHALLGADQSSTRLTLTLGATLTAPMDVDARVRATSGALGAEAPLRLHPMPPSGSPDLALGPDGTATIPIGGETTVYGLAFGADGAIVIGGDLAIGARLVPLVVRLTPDGHPDPAFGDGGAFALTDPKAGDASTRAVAVQTDQAIVAFAGRPPSVTQSLLYRLAGHATRDAAFGSGGILSLPDPGTGAEGCGLALGSDDASYVLLLTTLAGSDPQLVVEGRASNGAARASFGTNGVATLPFGMKPEGCGSILALEDGRTVVAGQEKLARGLVARLYEDGGLDPTFGDPGSTIYTGPRGNTDLLEPHGLAVDGDRILVLSSRASTAELEVLRLLPNGLPDVTFHGTGTLESPTDESGSAGKIAVDRSHRVVTMGRPAKQIGRLVIRRIDENGNYDATFAGTGVLSVDATRGALGIQPDGKIVVAHGSPAGVVVHRWYP